MTEQQSALEALAHKMLHEFRSGERWVADLTYGANVTNDYINELEAALTADAPAHEDQCDLGDCTNRADTGLCNFHWGEQIMVPAIEAEELTAALATEHDERAAYRRLLPKTEKAMRKAIEATTEPVCDLAHLTHASCIPPTKSCAEHYGKFQPAESGGE